MAKLNKLSPVQKLQLLRQMVKEGHRMQHQAQSIMSELNIKLSDDSTKADHELLGLMAKGNRYFAKAAS